MRATPATGNEIIAVVAFAAIIAVGIGYILNPANLTVETKEEKVVAKPVKKKETFVVGPGWGGGRWLGGGDFHFAEKMQHPFADQPRYAGHPFHMKDMDHAPPGPRLSLH